MAEREATPAHRRFAIQVFIVALVLRVAFVLGYPQFPVQDCDCFRYDEVGWNLATGKGFVGGFSRQTIGGDVHPETPEVAVGPLYGGFLAAVYLAAGHNFTAVRVTQAVLGALTALAVFFLVSAMASQRIARTAALLVALWPPLIFYTGVLLTETIFALLLVILAWAVGVAVRKPSLKAYAVAGVILGLSILHREEAALLAPVYAVLMLWNAPARRTLLHLAVLAAVSAMIVGGWTIRNYQVLNKFVLVAAHGGDTLWISTKGWTEWQEDDPELRSIVNGLTLLEQNDALGRAAIRSIATDPLRYLRVRLQAQPDFWLSSHTIYLVGFTSSFGDYYRNGEYGRVALKAVLLLAQVFLLVLAAGGIVIWSRRIPSLVWLLVPIVVVAVTHFFLFATARYLVPILPFFLVLAAASLDALAQHFGARALFTGDAHRG